MINIQQTIEEHRQVAAQMDALIPQIQEAAQAMTRCIQAGGKVLWAGNGGSAADSQHLAAELVGRFTRERKGMASIALTTDTSILTAIANDYGYDQVFTRQVEALCNKGDVFMGITTSGNSKGIVDAVSLAKEQGAYTIGLTGNSGGKLAETADLTLIMPSTVTARIQEMHILVGHILCDWVEEAAGQANA